LYKNTHGSDGKKLDPAHQPQYENNGRLKHGSRNNPRWNLIQSQFLATGSMPVQLRPYLMAAPDLSHGNNLVYTYGAGIRDYMRKYNLCGLQDGDFCNIPLNSTSVTDLHAALAEVEKDAGVNTADATTSVLVFLLLPSRSPQTYQRFKDLVDRTFGFHSICVTEAANIETKPYKGTEVGHVRPLDQYLGNVMMKVNLKFGGTNHSTELVRGKMKNTLILGADVSHAGPGAIQY
jgi:eukaryotic translation initiation factor 2C